MPVTADPFDALGAIPDTAAHDPFSDLGAVPETDYIGQLAKDPTYDPHEAAAPYVDKPESPEFQTAYKVKRLREAQGDPTPAPSSLEKLESAGGVLAKLALGAPAALYNTGAELSAASRHAGLLGNLATDIFAPPLGLINSIRNLAPSDSSEQDQPEVDKHATISMIAGQKALSGPETLGKWLSTYPGVLKYLDPKNAAAAQSAMEGESYGIPVDSTKLVSDANIEDQKNDVSRFVNEVSDYKKSKGLEKGQVQDTGILASVVKAITGEDPSSVFKSPQELAAEGAPITDLDKKVASAAGTTADPTNLAFALAPAVPGVGAALKGAGNALEYAGKVIPDAIVKKLSPGVAKIALGTAGGGGAALGAYDLVHNHDHILPALALAGTLAAARYGGPLLRGAGEMAQGIPQAEGTSTARLMVQRGIADTIGGAAIGAATNPSDPESGAYTGGLISAAFSSASGTRAAKEAAAAQAMADFGAKINLGNDNQATNEATMASQPQWFQDAINRAKAHWYGDGTSPVDIQVLPADEFGKATGSDTARGHYTSFDPAASSPDGKTIYLNADYHPKEAASTAGHEGLHALVDILNSAGRIADVKTLTDSINNGLTDEQKKQFADSYSDALKSDLGGKDPNLTPEQLTQEAIAENARKVLDGDDVSHFALPKPLRERVLDSASSFLEKYFGAPKAAGTPDLAFNGRSVAETARTIKDLLYDQGRKSADYRARLRGIESGDIEPNVPERLRQIDARTTEIRNTPPAQQTPAMVTELVNLTSERNKLARAAAQASPNPAPQAAAPSTAAEPPVAAPDTATVNQDARLKALNISPDDVSAARDEAMKDAVAQEKVRRGKRPMSEKSADEVAKDAGNEFDQQAERYYGALEKEGVPHPGGIGVDEAIRLNELTQDQGGLPGWKNWGARSKADAGPRVVDEPEEGEAYPYTATTDERSKLTDKGWKPDEIDAMPESQVRTELKPEPEQPAVETKTDDSVEKINTVNRLDHEAAGAYYEATRKPVGSPERASLFEKSKTLKAQADALRIKKPEPVAPVKPASKDATPEADVTKRLAEAETDARVSPQFAAKRTKETKDEFVKKAKLAVLQDIVDDDGAHDPSLLQTRDHGGVTGRLNDSIPSHRALLREMGVSDEAARHLFKAEPGQTVYVDYNSAKNQVPQDRSGKQRAKELRDDPAHKRDLGTIQTNKAILPMGVRVTKNGTVQFMGTSVDKFIANAHKLMEAAKKSGIETGYEDVNDPALAEDMHGYAENHANNVLGDGSATIAGKEATPGYVPYEIPEDRFNLLNAAMHNDVSTHIDSSTGKGRTEAMEAQERALENNRVVDPETGDTNPLRALINKDGSIDTIGEDGSGRYGTGDNLEPVFETLSPEQIISVNDEPSGTSSTVRDVGFTGNPKDVFKGGVPENRNVAAGFMPFAGKKAKGFHEADDKFIGSDGLLKWRISDKEMSFTDYGREVMRSERPKTVALGELVSHSKLFEAYPKLSRVKVLIDPEGDQAGINQGHTKIEIGTGFKSRGEILDILTHEIQHWIQYQEGFPLGQVEGDNVYNGSAGEIEARRAERERSSNPTGGHELESVRDEAITNARLYHPKKKIETIIMKSDDGKWGAIAGYKSRPDEVIDKGEYFKLTEGHNSAADAIKASMRLIEDSKTLTNFQINELQHKILLEKIRLRDATDSKNVSAGFMPSGTLKDIAKSSIKSKSNAQKDYEARIDDPRKLIEDHRNEHGVPVLNGDAIIAKSPVMKSASPEDAIWTAKDLYPIAKAARDKALRYLIDQPIEGNGRVTVMAGGMGSGKSTIAALLSKPEFIYDTNLSNLADAKANIDAILASGRTVKIALVAREPGDAMRSNVERSRTEKRVESADQLGTANSVARQNVKALADYYKGNENVYITAYENVRGNKPKEIPLDEVEDISVDDAKQRAHDVLDEIEKGNDEHWTGEPISPEIAAAARTGQKRGSGGLEASAGALPSEGPALKGLTVKGGLEKPDESLSSILSKGPEPLTEAGKKLVSDGFELEHRGEGNLGREIAFNKDGKEAGSLMFSIPNRGYAHVDELFVSPEFQRRGIASALYRELATELQNRGVTHLGGDVMSQIPMDIRKKIFGKFDYIADDLRKMTEAKARKIVPKKYEDSDPRYGDTGKVFVRNKIDPDAKFMPSGPALRDLNTGQDHKNEADSESNHEQIDQRTGRSTLITSTRLTADQAARISDALADRSRKLNAAIREAATTGKDKAYLEAQESELGKIELKDLGLRFDSRTELYEPAEDSSLKLLGSGGESIAFSDGAAAYKIFFPQLDGGVGISGEIDDRGRGDEMFYDAGTPSSTVEKLNVIARLGGIPSEIVGMTSGGALVVKQPLYTKNRPSGTPALNLLRFHDNAALKKYSGNVRYAERVAVVDGVPYFLSDLNGGNYTTDNQSDFRLSDAVTVKIPRYVIEGEPELKAQIEELTKAENPERANRAWMPGGDATQEQYDKLTDRIKEEFDKPNRNEDKISQLRDRRDRLGSILREQEGQARAKAGPNAPTEDQIPKSIGRNVPQGHAIFAHWGNRPGIDLIDPEFHGTGARGAESARRTEDDGRYVDRSYLGYGDYIKEPQLGKNKYVGAIDKSLIYDQHDDPLNIRPAAEALAEKHDTSFATEYERLIKEHGFLGYHNGEDGFDSGNAMAIFHPIPSIGIVGGKQFAEHAEDYARRSPEMIAAVRKLTPNFDNIEDSYFDTKPIDKAQTKNQNQIANEYQHDLKVDNLSDPDVKRSYEALATKIQDQFKQLRSDGINIEAWATKKDGQWESREGQPYASSKELQEDLRKNKRVYFFITEPSTFGSSGNFSENHPMLQDSGLKTQKGFPLLNNDILRAVHDAIAHGAFGYEFGPKGEEAAWKAHMATVDDPWARWALTTETRGQNSWVNFRDGLIGDDGLPLKKGDPGYIRPQDRPFADQKADLLDPKWMLTGDKTVDQAVTSDPEFEREAFGREEEIAGTKRLRSGRSGQFMPRGDAEPTLDENLKRHLSRVLREDPRLRDRDGMDLLADNDYEAYQAAIKAGKDQNESVSDFAKDWLDWKSKNRPVVSDQPSTESGKKVSSDNDLGFEHEDMGAGMHSFGFIDKDGDYAGQLVLNGVGDGKSAHIDSVEVHTPLRGKGIGEALYREAAKYLQSQGITKLTGDVISHGPLKIREKLFGKPRIMRGGIGDVPKEVSHLGSEDIKGKIPVRSEISKDAKFMPSDSSIKSKNDQDELGLYSNLSRVVDQKLANRATPERILATLDPSKSGVRKEELDWMGLPEFLKDKETVTKKELQDFIHNNQVELKEVQKSSVGKITKEVGNKIWQELCNIHGTFLDNMDSGYTHDDNTGELRDEIADDDAYFDTHINKAKNIMARNHLDSDDLQDAREEIEWAARIENKHGDDPITRNVLRMLDEAEKDDLKFSHYTLPGGKNYKEKLLTLPQREISKNKAVEDEEGDSWNIVNPNGEILERGFRSQYAAERAIAADAGIKQSISGGAPIDRGEFRSDHWDEPNVLAHIRQADHTDTEGDKVRLIEEIQSDWHQAGRKKGYKTASGEDAKDRKMEIDRELNRIAKKAFPDQTVHPFDIAGILERNISMGIETGIPKDEMEAAAKKARELTSEWRETIHPAMQLDHVPDAPFKKTWHELAFKRALRNAVEDGMDKIAWPTGETQAERYDLSKQVDKITYDPKGKHLLAERGGVEVFQKSGVEPTDLAKYIGKELAARITGDEVEKDRHGFSILSGDNLKVGGQGMKGFYDKILPDFVRKYVKKWGGKVETTTLNKSLDDSSGQRPYKGGSGAENIKVHSVTITPEMKASVMSGQPKFMPKSTIQTRGNKSETPALRNLSVPIHEDRKKKKGALADLTAGG